MTRIEVEVFWIVTPYNISLEYSEAGGSKVIRKFSFLL